MQEPLAPELPSGAEMFDMATGASANGEEDCIGFNAGQRLPSFVMQDSFRQFSASAKVSGTKPLEVQDSSRQLSASCNVSAKRQASRNSVAESAGYQTSDKSIRFSPHSSNLTPDLIIAGEGSQNQAASSKPLLSSAPMAVFTTESYLSDLIDVEATETNNDGIVPWEKAMQVAFAPQPGKTCQVFWLSIMLLVGFNVLVLYTFDHGERRLPTNMSVNVTDLPALGPAGTALALHIGLERQRTNQAALLVSFALMACVLSVAVASFTVTHSPKKVPIDFWRKGTLSNVAHDASTPHGRIFCVALFTASLLSLVSMYPFKLYRPWIPWLDPRLNPTADHNLESRTEVGIRCFWSTVPFIGLMITAAIPSTPVLDNYKFAQTMLHNACAPGSMGILLFMEVTQLWFGEQAFQHFFSNEAVYPPFYGPVTTMQRVRVLLCVFFVAIAGPFAMFQLYLFGGDALLWKSKSSYVRALASYFAEVVSMAIIFSLPFAASLEEMLYVDSGLPAVREAQLLLQNEPWVEM